MVKPELAELLGRHFPAWGHLTSEQKKYIAQSAVEVSYKKGACVHGADSECVGVLLIKKGMLRTYLLSEEGREVTLFRMGSGDTCVLSASCVLSSISFDVHIDAEVDTEALLIYASLFSRLKEENIYVECETYKLASERFSDVMWAMQQILFSSMDKRLAVFMWDEIAKTGGDTVHATHEQIARHIGSAREVVSRMLKYFVSEGIVELSRGGIRVLDKNKLKSLT